MERIKGMRLAFATVVGVILILAGAVLVYRDQIRDAWRPRQATPTRHLDVEFGIHQPRVLEGSDEEIAREVLKAIFSKDPSLGESFGKGGEGADPGPANGSR